MRVIEHMNSIADGSLGQSTGVSSSAPFRRLKWTKGWARPEDSMETTPAGSPPRSCSLSASGACKNPARHSAATSTPSCPAALSSTDGRRPCSASPTRFSGSPALWHRSPSLLGCARARDSAPGTGASVHRPCVRCLAPRALALYPECLRHRRARFLSAFTSVSSVLLGGEVAPWRIWRRRSSPSQFRRRGSSSCT